ncbi:helix-turn-helix domain-containing protein [Arenimonas terrae]|uniref:XRE family transcriptional regulator n=1 Tax=Arenimonas terrae TaxID=2546226 RepID=A0A5C4RU98_9GAMM|nr:helix-turn-helix transcriptional regulator [Arenimonas terrae]TNJ34796.1 XRE family transcriptional regulator [Arenimonas terrae]
MNKNLPGIGPLLQVWRRRRRMSQLKLAMEVDVSQRHLSFVESGRASPSRDLVLRLCRGLELPPRERNTLLVAAGYAPAANERSFDDPGLASARVAVERILAAHDPHPALAVDRHWNLLSGNRAASLLMAGVAPALVAAPVNVLRLSLHPEGLGPRVGNYRQWRDHVVQRLERQHTQAPDAALADLVDEIRAYPVPAEARPHLRGGSDPLAGLAVPFELLTPLGTLRFLSTTTVFGTAVDVLLSELVIEAFYPADAETAELMRRLSGS